MRVKAGESHCFIHKPSQRLLNTYYVSEIMLQSIHGALFGGNFNTYFILLKKNPLLLPFNKA